MYSRCNTLPYGKNVDVCDSGLSVYLGIAPGGTRAALPKRRVRIGGGTLLLDPVVGGGTTERPSPRLLAGVATSRRPSP